MSPVFGSGGPRLLGFALLVATFVAGALTGAAVDRVLNAEGAERAARERDRDRRSYIIDQVEMSAAQRDDIDAILEQRSKRMQAVWNEASPRLDAITDSARIEIMQVLTPEQRAEYERRLKEREEARKDRETQRRGEDGGQH